MEYNRVCIESFFFDFANANAKKKMKISVFEK